MLIRGMEVRLAELKGESIKKPMEMVHWIEAHRWKPERRAQYFQLGLPSTQAVLEESARLFDQNVDRLLENQEAMRLQDWKDTHTGETPRETLTGTRATQLNASTIRQAAILTAQHIQGYSSDVRTEFESAVRNVGMDVGEIYAAAGVQKIATSQREVTDASHEVLAHSGILRPLQIPNGQKIGTESLNVPAEGSETLRFTIDHDVMANFWVDSFPGRALSLTISGGTLPAAGYPSSHGLSSANSTSLKLTPGTYDITVQDMTNYDVMPHGNDLKSRPLDLPLHMDVREWNTREVVGKVSLPGESEAKDVSLRVAKFIGNDRVSDYTKVPDLDPNLPVWVVAHGREDHDESGKMEQLARELGASGYQVVTVDWSGARDNFPHAAGLQGEQWIEPTAAKVFEMLRSMGVSGEKISFGVHSWATLLAYEVAERYKNENGFGVQAIVALDPAKDPTLNIGYDARQVDFSKVSNASWGFHSSYWGSVPRTLTGGRALEIRSSDELSTTDKHGLVVTTFANLISMQRQDPHNDLASKFQLSALSAPQTGAQCDEIFEGWLWVNSTAKTDQDGERYIDAVPTLFTATNPDDGIPDLYRSALLSNSIQ
jgi:hypothetical protein